MKAVLLRPDEADAWKDLTAWHFDSFCRDEKWTPAELWAEIATGHRQMWLAFDAGEVHAVALTQIVDGSCKTCVVTHCAGQGRGNWAHLIHDIGTWAKALGCVLLEAVTRPGWERVLKDMRKTHVILEKRL